MIHFLVPRDQDFAIKDYLELFGQPLRKEMRILYYEDLIQQNAFFNGTYVLSALDQLNQSMAQLLFEIHEQLKQIKGFRFLNTPRNTLQRFALLNELNRLGKNEFRAFRANGDLTGLKFPVFLREENLHHGAISPLLDSHHEMRAALGRALVQGHELKNLLIVEFCETANEEGFYRKYGAFIVGKRVIPRSLNYGRQWMLKHSETEFTLPMVHEELEYVLQNPHQQQLLEIFDLAQVEYGRIDYSIKDHRVQTWEINLYPTIGRGARLRSRPLSPELDAVRDEVRRCFYERFELAWREVNLPTNAEPSVRVRLTPDVVRAAMETDVRPSRLLNTTKRILRPAKPLIVPLSPPFMFILGCMARLLGKQRT
jgi:hypothetical protein